MIIGADQQIMIGALVVFVVLLQVLQRGNLPVVVVSRDGQDRNVDAGEVILVRNHGLPILIVTRMLQPALQPFVRRAVNTIYLAVRFTAVIPFAVQSIPSLAIRIGFIIECFVIGDVKRPGIIGIQKHI